jgi:hypothetical protein
MPWCRWPASPQAELRAAGAAARARAEADGGWDPPLARLAELYGLAPAGVPAAARLQEPVAAA